MNTLRLLLMIALSAVACEVSAYSDTRQQVDVKGNNGGWVYATGTVFTDGTTTGKAPYVIPVNSPGGGVLSVRTSSSAATGTTVIIDSVKASAIMPVAPVPSATWNIGSVLASAIMPVAPVPSATWTTVNGQGPATSATVFPASGHQVPFSVSDTGRVARSESTTAFFAAVATGVTISIDSTAVYVVVSLGRRQTATDYAWVSTEGMPTVSAYPTPPDYDWIDQGKSYVMDPILMTGKSLYIVPGFGGVEVIVRQGLR